MEIKSSAPRTAYLVTIEVSYEEAQRLMKSLAGKSPPGASYIVMEMARAVSAGVHAAGGPGLPLRSGSTDATEREGMEA
jgi:hypothetical protein